VEVVVLSWPRVTRIIIGKKRGGKVGRVLLSEKTLLRKCTEERRKICRPYCGSVPKRKGKYADCTVEAY
jgi:hypothetical protein